MALIENKRAHLEYTILEEFEAGVELLGTEVKSLRAKRGKLEGARILVRGGEAYLVGASIPAWQQANAPVKYDPERPRRLLLTQKEILQVAEAEGQKGLTIIPIRVYNKKRVLKLLLAIARGKKKEDKRQYLKERDWKRQIERTLKNK
ncbi:MAG TPA: SsrA-binding protein SmpB [Candidatus Paceibacterota bacterium]